MTSPATSRRTRRTCRIRWRAATTTSRPISAPRPSSGRGSSLSGEAREEQTELEQEIHRDRDQRLVERVGCRRDDRADDEDQQEDVTPLLREPGAADDPHADERVDDDRYLEDDPHAEDERRDEREVIRRP